MSCRFFAGISLQTLWLLEVIWIAVLENCNRSPKTVLKWNQKPFINILASRVFWLLKWNLIKWSLVITLCFPVILNLHELVWSSSLFDSLIDLFQRRHLFSLSSETGAGDAAQRQDRCFRLNCHQWKLRRHETSREHMYSGKEKGKKLLLT